MFVEGTKDKIEKRLQKHTVKQGTVATLLYKKTIKI